jgi:hypothetical protein
MEHGLRVAGTVEIAGLEAAHDERRAKALLANVRTMFPEVNTDGHRFWMGFSPWTPDSLPMLGEATGRPGLFLAVGHGHFGMTGGPPSGRPISQLINGKPTAIDAAAYAPQRVGSSPDHRRSGATVRAFGSGTVGDWACDHAGRLRRAHERLVVENQRHTGAPTICAPHRQAAKGVLLIVSVRRVPVRAPVLGEAGHECP